MNTLARAILRLVFDRNHAAGDLARLPAVYRDAARGSLMGRIAAAGILRLAFRWPVLTMILILSVVAARVVSGRRRQPDRNRPALRS
jgi:hypothetical protein